MRTLTKGPYLIYYMMNTFLWFQWLTSMIWPLSSRSVSPDKSDWKWSWSYFQTHNRTKEKHKEHLNYLENNMGSFYRMVCFFESAVCNGEGGRLKGFQLIQFQWLSQCPVIAANFDAGDTDEWWCWWWGAISPEKQAIQGGSGRWVWKGNALYFPEAIRSLFLLQSLHIFF